MFDCSAPNCKNKSSQKQYTFHRLPSVSKLRIRWIEKCQQFGNWTPNDFHRICSAHFEQKHFYTLISGTKRLKRTAFPSIFNRRQIPIDLGKLNLFKTVFKPGFFSKKKESSCNEANVEMQEVNTQKNESSCTTNDNCLLKSSDVTISSVISPSPGSILKIFSSNDNKISSERSEMKITISRSGKAKTTNFESSNVSEKNRTRVPAIIPDKTFELLLELAKCRKTIDTLTVDLEVANKRLSCANEIVDSVQEKLANAESEIENLTTQLKMLNNNLSKFLEEDQIKVLYRGENESIKNRSWSEQTIMKSIKLKLKLGKQNYKFLSESGYPFPCYSTLNRRTKEAREQNTVILKEQNVSMSQIESRTPFQTMENDLYDSNLSERIAKSSRKHLFNKTSSPIVKKVSSSSTDNVVSDWKVVFVGGSSTSFMGDFLIDDVDDSL